jgi:hypothetical protein
LSKSDRPHPDRTTFDEWVIDEFGRSDGFTALVILVAIGDVTVTSLRSTFFHVIGDDIDWARTSQLLAGAGVSWDGAVFHTLCAENGGPVSDEQARASLRLLEKRIVEDRLTINDGHFFDNWGRRMKVEEAPVQ